MIILITITVVAGMIIAGLVFFAWLQTATEEPWDE